jgi:hypothetical protein
MTPGTQIAYQCQNKKHSQKIQYIFSPVESNDIFLELALETVCVQYNFF